MDVFSEVSGADDQTAGQDAGVLLGMMEKLRQGRDLLVPEEVQPVEGQVFAPTWGRWPW